MKRTIISDLPKTSAPAQRALEGIGITTLKQLTNVTEMELLMLHGMGQKAVRILREELKAKGWSFREPTNGGAMDKTIRSKMDAIFTGDGESQFKAYDYLMKESEKPVSWAYDVWDEVVSGLTNKDNHVRAICGQLLSNLAKSDPKERMLKDFAKLLQVTKDKRFVTARHTMQNLWKVGVVNPKYQTLYRIGMSKRFKECVAEKNGALIRYDILISMRNVYNQTKDKSVRKQAQALIALEADPKNQKKCAEVWKK